jgi:hypothetical protein
MQLYVCNVGDQYKEDYMVYDQKVADIAHMFLNGNRKDALEELLDRPKKMIPYILALASMLGAHMGVKVFPSEGSKKTCGRCGRKFDHRGSRCKECHEKCKKGTIT